jgi:hypothetical protein
MAGCALLAGGAAMAYLVVGLVGQAIQGAEAWAAAGVAALLCLAGAELALVSSRIARRGSPQGALVGLLVAMGCRLVVPLAGSLAIRFGSPHLFTSGALYYLVVFYLVTLTLEVGLELHGMPVRDSSGRSR